MLKILIVDEGFNNETEEFVDVDPVTIEIEHSLASLSKWESKYEKPFLGKDSKTNEETLDYIRMMIVTRDVDPDVIFRLTEENIVEIKNYIDSKQSATTFSDVGKARGRQEVITSELIYSWMIAFQIPFEAQFWHLNRLLTLIRICALKNGNQKKIPKRQLAQTYRDLNEQRKAQYGTSG